MSAVGVRVCPVCGSEFTGRRDGQQYCGATCRNEAMKPRGIAGESAAIVKSEYIPPRTSKMTEDEFDWWIAHFRRKLDDQPYRPGDLFWRRGEILRMADAGDKTTAHLARYFRVTPKQMRELIKAGRRSREDAA